MGPPQKENYLVTEMTEKSELTVSHEQKQVLEREICTIPLIKDVGFANVSSYKRIPGRSTPYEFLPDAQTAIVYIAKLDEVVPRFGKVHVINLSHFLKQTNDMVVTLLSHHGLYSHGVVDERVPRNLMGRISFRQLAVLAGLGTIGKNTCLLHPVYGPNVQIGVVLTTSFIPHDTPWNGEKCTHCDICLRECQTGALKNDSFDSYKCKNKVIILGKPCNTPCINSCPVG